jgi:hypothetical protein
MRVLAKALLDSRMTTTRLILALSSLTWAMLLLLPGELFTGRATYAVMALIANENVWGMLFLIHGVFALYTVKSNTANRVTLCLDGFLGCVIWTASTAACFYSHWPHLPTFWESLIAYRPPAAMSGELWLSVASWIHLIKHWAEEERGLSELNACERRCASGTSKL